MPPIRLFISYRSLDSARVDPIVAHLRSLSEHQVWFDKDSIPPGEDWWYSIVRAIGDCEVVLFMVSRESAKNANCRAELNYAHRRNRPIVPIVLEGDYVYSPKTGKKDIEFWPLIPDELKEMRAQFLFYDGSFANQLAHALDTIRQEPKRWRDIPAAETPPDPNLTKGDNINSAAIWEKAWEHAWQVKIDPARELFQRLVSSGDKTFGDFAYEWILILDKYAQLLSFDARPSAHFQIKQHWPEYTNLFPKAFVEFYDPRDIRGRYIDVETPHPSPSLAPVATPVPAALPTPVKTEFTLPMLEWINIPAGKVTLENDGGTHTVAPFVIAKYPVTNAQFQAFIDDGGYRENRYWQGLDQRETAPSVPKWNEPTCPRETVNWYEAMAFTRWLSEKTGLTVTLPTEMQWQWAAVGDKGWAYPYGNTFDKTKSNTRESGIKRTTPVDRYPQGASPFGVMDTCGNVWEWCLNEYANPISTDIANNNRRVLRSGSWDDSAGGARAAYRSVNFANNRDVRIGFRFCFGVPLL